MRRLRATAEAASLVGSPGAFSRKAGRLMCACTGFRPGELRTSSGVLGTLSVPAQTVDGLHETRLTVT